MNGTPKTPEEFQLWMVDKVGDIHTTQAKMLGEVRVMGAKHEALEARVDVIVTDAKRALGEVLISTVKHEALEARVNEIVVDAKRALGEVLISTANHKILENRVDAVVADAKTAKHWENAKFVVMYAVHAVANIFKLHI